MIKIRLHGEKEEIELACAAIKEHFDVLNVSHLYADRGDSVYKRAYIDAKIKVSVPVITDVISDFENLMTEFDEMGYCPTTFTDSPEADAKNFKDRLIEIYNRR